MPAPHRRPPAVPAVPTPDAALRRWWDAARGGGAGPASALLLLALALTVATPAERADPVDAALRRRLVDRAVATLRDACIPPASPELAALCEAEARYVVTTPECDERCLALAGRWRTRPRR
jgi:hypothetical protein